MRIFIIFPYSPNTVRVMKWRKVRDGTHVLHVREAEYAYRILVAKCDGRRLLERHRHR
jgi:hypothetical protein